MALAPGPSQEVGTQMEATVGSWELGAEWCELVNHWRMRDIKMALKPKKQTLGRVSKRGGGDRSQGKKARHLEGVGMPLCTKQEDRGS